MASSSRKSTDATQPPPPTTTSKKTTLQTLALHGSGGRARSFEEGTLWQWRDNLAAAANVEDHDTACTTALDLEITAVQGHVPKDDGFAWWFLPPGLRSSTATSYEGFDESCRLVMDAFKTKRGVDDNTKSFDLIVGHSQGAILLTALLALRKLEERHHPRVGYILNGVACPNPYTEQLELLKIVAGSTDAAAAAPAPRVLVIVGEKDAMNPPEQGERVARALKQAGYKVTTLYHPGGHAVPVQRGETWDAIQAWIIEGLKTEDGPKIK